MEHRDCVIPTKMAVEGSSIFTSTEQKGGLVESKDIPEESSPPASNSSTHSGKKKADDKPAEKSCRKGKRRRWDEPEPSGSSAGEFQTAVMEMWKRSIEQDNERFERSAEMFREAQNKQMDQTNAILTGFKDIRDLKQRRRSGRRRRIVLRRLGQNSSFTARKRQENKNLSFAGRTTWT